MNIRKGISAYGQALSGKRLSKARKAARDIVHALPESKISDKKLGRLLNTSRENTQTLLAQDPGNKKVLARLRNANNVSAELQKAKSATRKARLAAAAVPIALSPIQIGGPYKEKEASLYTDAIEKVAQGVFI